jgi:hypothetical protein
MQELTFQIFTFRRAIDVTATVEGEVNLRALAASQMTSSR